MSDILEQICADKRRHIEKSKIATPFPIVHRKALRAPLPRGFIRALRDAHDTRGLGFIAELKKASPSSGLLRNPYSPATLARELADAGATCLSVMTDEAYYQGCNQDLIDARDACSLPVLHRDFMLDLWQVAEARAIGADCIVLIMAVLDDATALALHTAATDYGMEVMIEIYTREEMARALKLPSRLININSRNLKTLKIDLPNAADLIRFVPPERFVVAGSGIVSPSDVVFMKKSGARGLLIGESLLKEADAGQALQRLRRAAVF